MHNCKFEAESSSPSSCMYSLMLQPVLVLDIKLGQNFTVARYDVAILSWYKSLTADLIFVKNCLSCSESKPMDVMFDVSVNYAVKNLNRW